MLHTKRALKFKFVENKITTGGNNQNNIIANSGGISDEIIEQLKHTTAEKYLHY